MPEKPIMHGRDHRPGGTDPIPGLGASGLNWAHMAMAGSNITVTASANNQFPCTGGQFYTNASSVFQSATNTDFSITGIQIMEAGHYLIFAQFSVVTFGSGTIDLICSLAEGPATFSSFFGMGEIMSSTKVYGDEGNDATITVIEVAQVNASSSGVPADPIVWNVRNNGANTATLSGGTCEVIQLDSDSTFIH